MILVGVQKFRGCSGTEGSGSKFLLVETARLGLKRAISGPNKRSRIVMIKPRRVAQVNDS